MCYLKLVCGKLFLKQEEPCRNKSEYIISIYKIVQEYLNCYLKYSRPVKKKPEKVLYLKYFTKTLNHGFCIHENNLGENFIGFLI